MPTLWTTAIIINSYAPYTKAAYYTIPNKAITTDTIAPYKILLLRYAESVRRLDIS